jgi:hypothetical protein
MPTRRDALEGTRPEGYKCIDQPRFFKVSGFNSLILDVAILVVPIPVVWSLQVPLRTRVALVLIFSVGFVYVDPLPRAC